MKRFTLATILLLVAGKPAFAGSAEGNGALSLAALVAEFSPTLPIPERRLLLKYLDGDAMPPLGEREEN